MDLKLENPHKLTRKNLLAKTIKLDDLMITNEARAGTGLGYVMTFTGCARRSVMVIDDKKRVTSDSGVFALLLQSSKKKTSALQI